MCGLMADLVICKFRKSMVIHDTECPLHLATIFMRSMSSLIPFFFLSPYFIMPHSYIPPSSGLGTRRLASKHKFLELYNEKAKIGEV